MTVHAKIAEDHARCDEAERGEVTFAKGHIAAAENIAQAIRLNKGRWSDRVSRSA